MVELSRNGVCYDIRHTPYTYTWRGMVWHFSSEPHRLKFVENVRKREMWLNDSLSRRFKCTCELEILADVQLYSQIESRGFYVVTMDQCEYTKPAQMFVVPDARVLGIDDA